MVGEIIDKTAATCKAFLCSELMAKTLSEIDLATFLTI
jgi:hypothetical protein